MFLRSAEAANKYGVDAVRIVVAGHSMGGLAAAMTAAGDPPGDPPLAGLVLLDAWNAGATARQLRSGGPEARAAFIARLDDLGHALGPITPADVADGLIRRGEAWDLAAAAPKLAHGGPDPATAAHGPCRRLPILTVWAAHEIAVENKALAEALRRAGASVTAVELESDHAFADSRIRLAAEVAGWLQALDSRARKRQSPRKAPLARDPNPLRGKKVMF